MAKARNDIQALLEQFNRQVRESAKNVHNVDVCANDPFPECGVCLSLLDPIAIKLIAALSDPNAPRA